MEKAIRGRISLVSLRRAKANKPRMGPRYNPEKPMVHLAYVDENNLYGLAMSDPLPTRGFEWLTEKEIESLDIEKLDIEDSDGYIFEVK